MTITGRKEFNMENNKELMEQIERFASERESIEKEIDNLMISAYAEVCKAAILRARIDNSPIAGPIIMPNWMISKVGKNTENSHLYHFYSDDNNSDVVFIIIRNNLRSSSSDEYSGDTHEEELRNQYSLGERIW